MSARSEALEVQLDERRRAPDEGLRGLLTRVYVDGGFTAPEVAAQAFEPAAVRARGRFFWCAGEDGGKVAGVVMMVPPTSPARRLAAADEAELHLLAVDARYRGRGIGTALVEAVIAASEEEGYQGLVLWTQPAMVAAHHVYERAGFVASPKEDFKRDGRRFCVMRRGMAPR